MPYPFFHVAVTLGWPPCVAAIIAARRRRDLLAGLAATPARAAMLLLVCGTLGWLYLKTAALGLDSLRWPLILDAPLMNYIAVRILHGAAPYRDIFDMNFPGAYVLHMLAVSVGGNTDRGWRVFDLIWLGMTCGFLWCFCRRFSLIAAAAAVVFYATFHISNGPINEGQRDYLLFLFLIAGTYWTARSCEAGTERHRNAFALAAGLALGFGATIKPTAVLLPIAIAFVARLRQRDEQTKPLPVTPFAVGALASMLAIGLWLLLRGGLGAFIDITLRFTGPIYQHLGRPRFLEAARIRASTIIPCASAFLFSLPMWRGGLRRRLLITGVAYGAAHFVIQAKGNLYHLYPLAGFACALAASWVDSDVLGKVGARQAVRAAAFILFAVWLGFWSDRLDSSLYFTGIAAGTVSSLEGDLRAHVPPGGSVQVLDTAAGSIHALMRAHVRLATPYIYDFPFFSGGRSRFMNQHRRRFLRLMQAAPPDAIVFTHWAWPSGAYERINVFPEFARWMAANYTVGVERFQYRVYLRRPAYHP